MTDRSFLRAFGALLLSCVWLPGCGSEQWVRAGQWDRFDQGVTFLQITDVHLTLPPGKGGSSPELLKGAVAEITGAYPKAEFVVSTGDHGTYDEAHRDVWKQAAFALPMPLLKVEGNCEPPYGWKFMDKVPAEYPTRAWRLQKGNCLMLMMDSSLQGWHESVISKDQLAWLDRELGAADEKFVFIFMHHPTRWIANAQELRNTLRIHRPRQKAIVLVAGHTHSEIIQQDGLLNEVVATALQDGRYRVFHVLEDRVVTYERWSEAWKKLQAKPSVKGELASGPVVIPAVPRWLRPPAVSAKEAQVARATANWPGQNRYPQGDVLRLDFAEGRGCTVHDRSGQGNDVHGDVLFWLGLNGRKENPWVQGDWGSALNIGHPGVPPHGNGTWEMSGFDCRSLNSPAITNRLTLEAKVRLSAGDLAANYALIDKGSYALTLDPAGRPGLRLVVTLPAGQKTVTLAGKDPLFAGKWHTLRVTFDGQAACLYVDGALVGRHDCEGAKLCATEGVLRIAGRDKSIKPGPPTTELYLSAVRVSNQCEPPTAKQ